MSTLMKTPLDILKEAAESETFSVTDMIKDQIKAEFKDTYAEITTVEENVKYRPEMIPVFESTDKSTYYVEMDNVVKYMKSSGVKDIEEALYDIAECNNLSSDNMTILIESDDWAMSVLEEASKAKKADGKDPMDIIKKSTGLIKNLKKKGIKLAKKKK